MGKLRILGLFIVFYLWFGTTNAQYYDTFPRYGFSSVKEAADSLYVRLLDKEYRGVQVFTINYPSFIRETRKVDTVVPEPMIRGQYITYWSRCDRSFKKARKAVKKAGYSAKKCQQDTVLYYKNTGAEVTRAELYIQQKKGKGYLKFQLWRIEEKWYLTGKVEWVEVKPIKS